MHWQSFLSGKNCYVLNSFMVCLENTLENIGSIWQICGYYSSKLLAIEHCNVFGDRVTIVYKDVWRIAKDVHIETKVIKLSASIHQSLCSWHYDV